MSLRNVRTLVPIVAVALVAILPLLVTDRYLLKVLTFTGINALVVVGLALLFGHAGQVSLGHAAFMGIGAYTCAYTTVELEWPWVAAFALSGAVAGFGGLLLAMPSLRLKGHYLAMATLGFGELMTVTFKEAEPVTGGVDGFGGIPFPALGPIEVDEAASLYWLVWGLLGIALLVTYNITSTRPGRAMRALHGSELGAQACGVDVVGIKVRSFIFSALLAGLGGALYASVVGFVSPSSFSLAVSVTLLAMTVIGGTGSLTGPLVAAVLLTLLQYPGAVVSSLPDATADAIKSYQEDIYGLAIILVVVFAPSGLAGLWRRRGKGRATP